ncbi:MAG: hypothetical protein J7K31_00835 [Candidatus Aenigmarchaeota archaeon]|nr:hypothetical protein [Candidatus Aenigmarchaeota archaeon]
MKSFSLLLSIIGTFILIVSFSIFVQSIYLKNITSEDFFSTIFDSAMEKQLPDICSQANLTECSSMSDVVDQICDKYGETSIPCVEIKKRYQEMMAYKDGLYRKEVFAGFSMFKLNHWINLTNKFGILFILLGMLLIYLSDKRIKTLLKKISIVLLFTGISCLLFRFFIASFFQSQNIPTEIVQSLFSDMMIFEVRAGLLCIVAGIVLFSVQYLAKEKDNRG